MDKSLEEVLSKIPVEVKVDEVLPYLERKSNLTLTEINRYIVLGIKSINNHYTKSHFALCLDCIDRDGDTTRAFCYGQKGQLLKKMPCGCSNYDNNFRKNIEEKVKRFFKPHPHLSYVSHDERKINLLCTNHGKFSLGFGAFVGKEPKKFFCKKCYHEVLGQRISEKASQRKPQHYIYPYPPKGIAYVLGSTFKAPKGNIYTITKLRGGGYVDVVCNVCREASKIHTGNLKVGQTPCSCSIKSKPKTAGDVVTTKHGNNLTVKDSNIKYLWVECNICHKDQELWKEPVKVLRGTINNGGSPCSCASSCIYTKAQYRTKTDRVFSNLKCYNGFKFSSDGKVTLKSSVEVYCNEYQDWYNYSLANLFSKNEVRCKLCNPPTTGFNVNSSGKLYLMVFESLNDEKHVFKIGITNRKVTERFEDIVSKTKGYRGFIYSAIEFSSGQACLDAEKEVKRLYVNKRTNALKIRFGDGFTETFTWDLGVLQELITDLVYITGVYLPSSDNEWFDSPYVEGDVRLLPREEY
jgi:hypothetical protein